MDLHKSIGRKIFEEVWWDKPMRGEGAVVLRNMVGQLHFWATSAICFLVETNTGFQLSFSAK